MWFKTHMAQCHLDLARSSLGLGVEHSEGLNNLKHLQM